MTVVSSRSYGFPDALIIFQCLFQRIFSKIPIIPRLFQHNSGHFYFRTCIVGEIMVDTIYYILICKMILLFYYFLVIGHFNNIINNKVTSWNYISNNLYDYDG